MAEHPITPSPELRQLWAQQAQRMDPHDPVAWQQHVATQAARWGADQELEACISLMLEKGWMNQSFADNLRAARRPKPPSHKELALIALTALEACAAQSSDTTESVFYIRRALESLPD